MSYTSKNPKLKVFKNKSLLHLSQFSEDEIVSLFEEAKRLQEYSKSHPDGDFADILGSIKKGVVALLFFENSTRTRMSFESAVHNLALKPLLLDAHSGSSLHKGETPEDTILNIASMDPKAVVIRCGDRLDLDSISQKIKMPIINAGWGAKGHPTQALLDLFTLWRERPLKGTRLMIVGDILHSRVASSHFEIFERLGVEIAGCGPQVFKPVQEPIVEGTKTRATSELKWFNDLNEGLNWCDVVIALRVQTERHSAHVNFFSEDFRSQYGINLEKMKLLKPDGLLLHPGPVNWGIELDREILSDPRVRILQQVNNGLYLRMALLKSILEC